MFYIGVLRANIIITSQLFHYSTRKLKVTQNSLNYAYVFVIQRIWTATNNVVRLVE